MLDCWFVLTGVAGTLIAIHIFPLLKEWRHRRPCQRTWSLHQIDSNSQLQSITVNRNSLPADLKLGPTLGSGAFGTVYKGAQVCTNDMSRGTVSNLSSPDENEQHLKAVIYYLHRTGTWKGVIVAVKTMEHQCPGSRSYMAVTLEKLLGIASVHPNVVSTLLWSCSCTVLSPLALFL